MLRRPTMRLPAAPAPTGARLSVKPPRAQSQPQVLRSRLLPGVLREHLLSEGKAREAELTLDDLAQGFWLGNAVRGLMRAELV